MTVTNAARTAGPFAGDGAATAFPFLFRVLSEDDIRVVRVGSDGTRQTLQRGLHYSVDLLAGQADTPGGTVRTTAPLPVGYKLEIRRTVPAIQPLDLQNRGGFYPEAMEEQFDRQTIGIQQIEEDIQSTLRVPDLGGIPELPSVEDRRGRLLGFDSTTGAPRLFDAGAVGGGSGGVSPAPTPSPSPSPSPSPATDTVLMNGLVAAALVAATTAAGRAGNVVKDLTEPPAPVGVSAVAGAIQATINWTAASYTIGHGPGRVIVYAATWVGGIAPLVANAVSLGGIGEPAASTRIFIDPGQKMRFWLAFESYDGVEGPKSAAVDVELQLLQRSMFGSLLVEAQDLANSLELGRLVNDPTFAGGAAAWANFKQRAAATASSAPPNCPVSFCAEFQGRDCISGRSFNVDPSDSYRLSLWANAGVTGLQVGIVVYEDYADGRATTAKLVASQTSPAGAWQKLGGTAQPSPGAVRWRVGPWINQPHAGTQSCWFAAMRVDLMMSTNLIVEGAIVAASMSTSALEAVNADIQNLKVDAANITGTLTAQQIDARGLQIKDAAGNVILGLGAQLDGQYIKVGAATRFLPSQRITYDSGVVSQTIPFRELAGTIVNISNRGVLMINADFWVQASPATAPPFVVNTSGSVTLGASTYPLTITNTPPIVQGAFTVGLTMVLRNAAGRDLITLPASLASVNALARYGSTMEGRQRLSLALPLSIFDEMAITSADAAYLRADKTLRLVAGLQPVLYGADGSVPAPGSVSFRLQGAINAAWVENML